MDALPSLRGNCPAIVAVKDKVQRLLRSPELRRLPPILIQGETGTGKGLLARGIHAASRRRHGPFVDVNSAAIPESLLEAELFGFERGAFTDARQAKVGLFQAAQNGTIFLDEIGLLPTALQGKLLKVIEERAVRRLGSTVSMPLDVWIVAATNEALQTAVRERRFREDLFHRLAVFMLELPPLRERGDDIVLLAEEFLGATCAAYGLPVKAFTPEARSALIAYSWPGNVRELGNVIERVALLTDERRLTAEMLGLSAETTAIERTEPVQGASASLDRQVETLERQELLRMLEETRWNVSQAAARLGITRNMIRYRVDKYGLRPAATRRQRLEPAPRVPTVTLRKETTPEPQRWERRLVALLQATVSPLAGAEGRSKFSRDLDLFVDKIQSFAGRIEEASPTGVVAAFGLEPAEDAPRRAALAALAIQEAMARGRRAGGTEGAVTTTIHADHVTVGQIGGRAELESGAKRQMEVVLEQLSAHSAPDTIAVSKTARGFLQRRFEFTEGAGHDLPLTFGGQLAGYQALRFGPSGYTSPFVGRQHELGVLRDRWQDALAGRGQVVALVGEAGIGKSRLLFEFRESLRGSKFACLEGHAESYGSGVPQLPVIGLLKAHFDIVEEDDLPAIREKVRARLLALVPPLEENLTPTLAILDVPVTDSQWPTLDPAQRRQRMLNAWKRLLVGESQAQPVMLVVEDLHWSDSETQAFLESALASVPATRILVLLSYRPEFEHGWGNRSYYTQLKLGPVLVAELLRTLIGDNPGLLSLRTLLIERSEGNPFFLEETVRSLVEAGVLAGDRGAYRPTRAVDSIEVPATVQAVLAARIDRLPPESKRLLQAASVIGKDVPFALLKAIADMPEDDVRQRLARLQGAEFLCETRLFPEVEYTFRHALTYEVTYSGVLHERRRELHARIVDAIETLYQNRLAEQIEQLAHHTVRGELWPRAVAYLRQAGAKAAARSANREAAGYFEQALDALAHLPDDRPSRELAIDLRVELRFPLLALGEFHEILDRLREADELAEALGDRSRQGLIAVRMMNHLYFVGALERGVEYGERALSIARELGDVELGIVANVHLGEIYHARGEFRRTIDLLRDVIDSIEAHGGRYGDAVGLAVLARFFLVHSLSELGEFDEAIVKSEEALRIADAIGHPWSRVIACLGAAVVQLRRGDLDRHIGLARRALELCQAIDLPFMYHQAATHLGYAYAISGAPADGVLLLEQAVKWIAPRRGPYATLFAAWLAEAYLLAGRADEAAVTAERAVDLARTNQERGQEAWITRLLGETAAGRNPAQVQIAQDRYRQAIALADERAMRPLVAHCHLGLAKLYGRTGKREQAQEHLTTATAMYREMGMTYWLEQTETAMSEHS